MSDDMNDGTTPAEPTEEKKDEGAESTDMGGEEAAE